MFRTLERLNGATLAAVQLETGRTHQIRVHFAEAGHPVLGDRVYGERTEQSAAGGRQFARQMLHARRLGFAHPRTGEIVRVESKPPADFQEALAELRAKRKRPAERGAQR